MWKLVQIPKPRRRRICTARTALISWLAPNSIAASIICPNLERQEFQPNQNELDIIDSGSNIMAFSSRNCKD